MAPVPPRASTELPDLVLDGPVRPMQLRVWLDGDAAWRASLVMPDAQVHEFSSPFALARHLSRLLRPSQRAGRGDAAAAVGPGLR